MKTKINLLLNSTISYSFLAFFEKITPLLLLPYLTTQLSVENYGYLYTFIVIITFLEPTFNIGFSSYQQKKYYESTIYNRKKLFGVYTFIQLLILLLILLISILLYWILNYYFDLHLTYFVILLILGLGFVKNLYQTIVSYFKISYNFKWVLFNSIIMVFLDLILTFLFIQWIENEWYIRLIAMLISFLSVVCCGYFYVYKKGLLILKFDYGVLKDWINFGKSIIIHRWSSIIFNLSDRVLITFLISAAATGVYTVGYQVSSILGIFGLALNQAYSPWLFKYFNSNKYNIKKVKKIIVYAILSSILIYIFLIFVSPWVLPYFIDIKKYNGLFNFINIIALSFIFQLIYFCFVPFLLIDDRTKLLAIITFIAAFTNIFANIIFLQKFGSIAAAYTTLFCWLLQALLVYLYFKKNEKKYT